MGRTTKSCTHEGGERDDFFKDLLSEFVHGLGEGLGNRAVMEEIFGEINAISKLLSGRMEEILSLALVGTEKNILERMEQMANEQEARLGQQISLVGTKMNALTQLVSDMRSSIAGLRATLAR